MSRILLYGPLVIILTIGGWYYYQGENAPEVLLPIIVMLLGVMSYGYGEKAKKDGDIGRGGKIKRDKNPKAFKTALYINHGFTAGLIILSLSLLLA